MSRVNLTMGFGESKSQIMSTKFLASAHSCAERVQASLEGLGGVSNVLLLTGVGAGLVVSFLTSVIIDRSLALASSGELSQTASESAGSTALGVEFP